MHKIAILKTRDVTGHYEDYEKIIDKITDFEEVSDEVFEKLRKAQYEFGFSILEQPAHTDLFIANTVAEYDALIEKREAEKRRADELSRRKNEEAKRKKKLLAEARERLALEKLIKDQITAGNVTPEEATKILSRAK